MKKILILSDLHVGGFRSIWPEGGSIEVEPGERQTWQLTRGQEYLWECWQHLLTTLPNKIDAVIVNGDVIQGHRDPWSTRLCASSFNDQESAAVQLLQPLAKRSGKMFFTTGTKYHQPDFADSEQKIARELKAKHLPWLNLKIGNKLINAVHGHSTGFVYRTTMLEREAFFAVLASRSHQTPIPSLIIRSHIHFYAQAAFKDIIAIFTPCWQLPDESLAVRLASFYKQHPLIGAVLVSVNAEDMPQGIQITPLTYDTPEWNSQIQEL